MPSASSKSEAPPEAATAELPAVEPEAKPTNVIEAIVAVMREVRAVGKDGTNSHDNYSFRGVDGVVNALGPAMRKVGLVCMPLAVREFEYGEIEIGRNRTKQAHVKTRMVYRFYGPGGVEDSVDAEVPGESMDSGDKATAKAMSVAYRTVLLQSFALPTEDRDPDADTHERSPALTADEVLRQVNEAAATADPQEGWRAVLAVGNDFGEQSLDRITVRGPDGHPMTGADYVRTVLADLEQKGKALRVRQAQDAAERPDTPQVPAEEPRLPAEQPAGDAEPANVGQEAGQAPVEPQQPAQGAPAPVPAAAAEQDARQEQAALVGTPTPSGRDKMIDLLLAETAMQAELLAVPPRSLLGGVLDDKQDPRTIPMPVLRKTVVSNRARAVAALREQGRATEAEAYNRAGNTAPATVDSLLGRNQDDKQPA